MGYIMHKAAASVQRLLVTNLIESISRFVQIDVYSKPRGGSVRERCV
jgi:hypothetical protein